MVSIRRTRSTCTHIHCTGSIGYLSFSVLPTVCLVPLTVIRAAHAASAFHVRTVGKLPFITWLYYAVPMLSFFRPFILINRRNNRYALCIGFVTKFMIDSGLLELLHSLSFCIIILYLSYNMLSTISYIVHLFYNWKLLLFTLLYKKYESLLYFITSNARFYEANIVVSV